MDRYCHAYYIPIKTLMKCQTVRHKNIRVKWYNVHFKGDAKSYRAKWYTVGFKAEECHTGPNGEDWFQGRCNVIHCQMAQSWETQGHTGPNDTKLVSKQIQGHKEPNCEDWFQMVQSIFSMETSCTGPNGTSWFQWRCSVIPAQMVQRWFQGRCNVIQGRTVETGFKWYKVFVQGKRKVVQGQTVQVDFNGDATSYQAKWFYVGIKLDVTTDRVERSMSVGYATSYRVRCNDWFQEDVKVYTGER